MPQAVTRSREPVGGGEGRVERCRRTHTPRREDGAMSDPKNANQDDANEAEELPDGAGPTSETTPEGGDEDQFQG
jgi:hypothetical protein